MAGTRDKSRRRPRRPRGDGDDGGGGRAGVALGRLGWALLSLGLAVGCAIAGASSLSAWREAERPAPPVRGTIQLEVLNGCGRPGVAQRAARSLAALGFDVVRSGNAERFDHEKTTVIDRSGREGRAGEVASALGCSSIERDPRPESFLDATVVVGRDFESLPGFAVPSERKAGK